MWAGHLAAFAHEHCAVAMDLPAHGRSSRLDAPATIGEAVGAVLALLDAVPSPPLVLVGHGYGGHVALATALARPARVRGVVTIGTAARGCFPEEHVAKLRQVVQGRLGQQFDTPYFGAKPDMDAMRLFWTELTRSDPKVRLADIEAYAASDLSGALGSLDRPVLALRGEQDRICPQAAAEQLVSALPRARLEVIPEAGHVAHLERAAEVQRATLAWLA
jgi:pimeloyl-ACP methyl ester carboxylesterase